VGRLFVEAPARIEPGVVDRLGDAAAGSQSLPYLRGAMPGCIVFGRYSGNRLEHAVEIAWAAPNRVRQCLQRGLVFPFLDKPARLHDQGRVLGFDGWTVGVAPFARPEAGRPCFVQGVVELNIAWIGSARRARRPTIDAGRGHRVPELAV